MGFTDWARETAERYRSEPVSRATLRSGMQFLNGVNQRLERRMGPFGRNIYAEPWETCVVLDACRQDLFEEVTGESGSARSIGSVTDEWVGRTFDEATARETVYVTANPKSRQVANLPWKRFVGIWTVEWDETLETVPPDAVTRYALAARERYPDARLVAHYMQPHHPFTAGGTRLGETWDRDGTVWDRLERGTLDRDTVWAAYRANLEAARDSVERLLRGLDRETVLLTSDHGNAMGEFGLYGHPPKAFIRACREVPWVRRDSGPAEPHGLDVDVDLEYRPGTEDDVEDRLRRLGYR